MLKITEKLRPFSHQPGAACLVPGTAWVVRAYPAMIVIDGAAFPIEITGPVREFTLQMDLERDCVWIWGIAKEGHFRFKLAADEIGLSLFVDRCPKNGIVIGAHHLQRKDKILLREGASSSRKKIERLSLGNWKEQDWDLVCRRNDVREWVPALYVLGQKTAPAGIAKGGPLDLLEDLPSFFHAAFGGILLPHLTDPLHQGLFLEDGHGDPLALLSLAFKKIRSFLIQGEKILPALPSGWDCGRILGLQTPYGLLDLEWTRGSVRQMILYAATNGEVRFGFSKPIQSFRLNGKRMERDSSVAIELGKKYHFDRFQK